MNLRAQTEKNTHSAAKHVFVSQTVFLLTLFTEWAVHRALLAVLLSACPFHCCVGISYFICLKCQYVRGTETSACWSGYQLNASRVKCKCKTNDILQMHAIHQGIQGVYTEFESVHIPAHTFKPWYPITFNDISENNYQRQQNGIAVTNRPVIYMCEVHFRLVTFSHWPCWAVGQLSEAGRVSDELVQDRDNLSKLWPVAAPLLPAVQHELMQHHGTIHRGGKTVALVYCFDHLWERRRFCDQC